MGFPILVRRHLYIESGPWSCSHHCACWRLVDSIHKRPVMQKTFPLHDIIMNSCETQPIFASNFQGPVSIVKTVFPRYADSHAKDKTVGETVLSLAWESHTGKTTSLFWDGPMLIFSNMIDHQKCLQKRHFLEDCMRGYPGNGPINNLGEQLHLIAGRFQVSLTHWDRDKNVPADDGWIPFTKGQLCRKHFYAMT